MSTELDIEFSELAKELIDESGKQVTFKATVQGAYNTATGNIDGGSISTFSCKVSPPEEYKQKYIDGDIIKVGDVSVMVASADVEFEPSLEDIVVMDSVDWRIKRVGKLYSGEDVAAYKLQLRS